MLTILLSLLCACAKTPAPEATYQPYTCIPPSRPAAPSASPATAPRRVAIIGDSYTSGSPQGGTGDRRWTAVVTAQLRARGLEITPDIGAEGGSGYVHGGNHGGGTFGDKVAATVKPIDKMVIFFGSRNDTSAPSGQLAHATCDALRKAEIAAPGAQLLVIGPPWVNASPPRGVMQARDILRERTKELGGQFVDPIADGWFVDRPDLIGTDGVHPTDAGHQYMADKIWPLIEQRLTAPAAP